MLYIFNTNFENKLDEMIILFSVSLHFSDVIFLLYMIIEFALIELDLKKQNIIRASM